MFFLVVSCLISDHCYILPVCAVDNGHAGLETPVDEY